MFFRKSKTASNDNQIEPPPVDNPAVPPSTIVAPGTLINGNIDCDGDLLVDGRVRGSVRAESLLVSAEGTIEGEASADDVVVEGYIKGPVRARHIHLLAGALVEGNLSCVTVTIDTGARLSGTVRQEQPASPDEGLFMPDPEPAAFPPLSWNSSHGDAFRPLAAVRTRLAAR